MRFRGECYRAHHPKWSFALLSGAGAATQGGRFNPKGLPALYLGLTLEGAVIEAAQGFGHKLEPLTICLYDVDCENIIDLRTDAERLAAGVELRDMACAWALDVSEGREPLSWELARRLIASGAAGALVPSLAHRARADMTNLVLWRWGTEIPHKVQVHDPSNRLPKNQLSWTSDRREDG